MQRQICAINIYELLHGWSVAYYNTHTHTHTPRGLAHLV